MVRWLIVHALMAFVGIVGPMAIYGNRSSPGLAIGLAFIFAVLAALTFSLYRPYWAGAPTGVSPASPPMNYWQRRAAKIQRNGGRYTEEEWRALCDHYQEKCLCCGKKRKLTADHIISVEHGGSSDISNIQPLCRPCNSSKGTRMIDYRSAK